jgi:hypothetical protein
MVFSTLGLPISRASIMGVGSYYFITDTDCLRFFSIFCR